jgi:regulator of sigma E protease
MAESLTFGEPGDIRTGAPFESGQTIVAMDGRPIEHSWQISRWELDYFRTHPGKDVPATMRFTVENDQGDKETDEVAIHLYLDPRVVFLKSTGEMLKLAPDGREDKEDKQVQLTLTDGQTRLVEAEDLIKATEPQDILGMRPRVWVKGVMKDSPADEAGLEPGDVIYEYYDRVLPTMTQILEINKEVEEGGGIIVVIRDGQAQPPKQITPKMRSGRPLIGIAQLPDVGHAVIADLREGSPAGKAGLKRQDRILTVNGAEVSGWIDVFNAVRQAQMAEQAVVFTVDRGGEQPETIDLGTISLGQFNPEYYRLDVTNRLLPRTALMAPEVHLGPIEAIGWGVSEAGRLAARTYITLKGLLVGSVSTREVSGPVGIGDMAIKVGRRSLVKFVWFIAMISVSLAVINFLPLPVVDGGHAVLLIVEKIRGKPVPVKVQNIIQIVGLVLLIGLFLLITFQDITRLLGRMW